MTPDIIIECRNKVYLFKHPSRGKVILKTVVSGSQGIIPGWSTFLDNESPMRVLTEEEFRRIKCGELHITFGALIFYKDVFGTLRRSITGA